MNPIIADYLTQIMDKHYHMGERAPEEAAKLMEIFELYGLQLIVGEWIVPEKVVIRLDPFDMLMETAADTIAREPWKAPELN